MKFSFTVRDNKPGAGGIDNDTLTLRVSDQAGPFKVTYPNTSNVTWQVGEYQIVTWDVTNTDKAPVNCQKVNIKLSTNLGQSFPVTLATDLPNTGRACILVPNNVTNSARIRVEAADNVFLDISNANFRIQAASQAGFTMCTPELSAKACLPNAYTSTVSTSAAAGFSDPITLSVTGLPNGATATFSPNPVQPGNNSVMTIEFPGATPESTFSINVVGVTASKTLSIPVTMSVVYNDLSEVALQTPADGSVGISTNSPLELKWAASPNADSYEVQLASSPSFATNTIVAAVADLTVTSYTPQVVLEKSKVLYWRVRAVTPCGPGPWVGPFGFSTVVESCLTLTANDLPKNISSTGTPTVESTININGSGIVSDVNVKKVTGEHDFFKDLEVRLLSPAGANVLLWKDKCGASSTGFNLGFDDAVTTAFPCPPTSGATVKPTEPLTAFNGQNSQGAWKLRVKDNQTTSGGSLSTFQLEVCSSASLNPPFIVNNNLLQINSGANAPIGNDLLKADDPNNTAGQLTFTLITVPKYGVLRKNFGANDLVPGDQFTQADLDNGAIRFFDGGFSASPDEFRFAVTDGEGGYVTGKFTIQPINVGTETPELTPKFELSPNPANDAVRLIFSEATSSDLQVRLFNAAGSLVLNRAFGAGTVTETLGLQGLPKGVYTVAVQTGRGVGARKLILQ